MKIKNAIIESAEITTDDHGCLSAWLYLNFENSGQGFGGYALYLPKGFTHHKIESVAGHFIYKIMQIADVTNWSQLNGKTIRVQGEHHKIHGIGHIINDDWFFPEDEFRKI